MNDDKAKGISSLLTIMMIVIPLVSILFTTIYFFNSYEFIEMLVAQPLRRSKILLGVYAGVGFSLLTAFLVGIGIPVMIFDGTLTGCYLIMAGGMLTFVFVSLAFLSSVITRDKTRGIGIALLIWFFYALIFDGILLMVLFALSDYPLEKATIIICCLNPVDLARIMVLLKMDISALMGYTGAVFNQFFGSGLGILISISVLALWILAPLLLALQIFNKKNL
jgi:Cu-processing system permease protein